MPNHEATSNRREEWIMKKLGFQKRAAWLVAVISVLLGLVVLAYFRSGSASDSNVDLAASPEPFSTGRETHPENNGEIVIDLKGCVRQPGVYRLPSGSRVADAVQKAGGANSSECLKHVNLAAKLQDGEEVFGAPRSPESSPGTDSSPKGDPLVNINTATVDELTQLPGIGKARAQKIIDYRQQNGPFSRVDDLNRIPGIKGKEFEKIRSMAVVD
jgi:competence protein ComEA